MSNVKPLFDEPDTSVKPIFLDDDIVKPKEQHTVFALDLPDEVVAPKKVSTVISLDLPDEPIKPKKEVVEIKVHAAFESEEHPLVRQAMEKGQEKFPLIMKESGFLVRDNLNSIFPISFDTLSIYGSDLLTKAASLIEGVTRSIEKTHEVNAEAHIKAILEHADTTKHKPSLLGLLNAGHHFNPVDARDQLSAIQKALRLRLIDLETLVETVSRVAQSMSIKMTVMAIVEDMSDPGDTGSLVARKANLFSVSLQEIGIATKQIQNIKKQTQEWIIRCEEISTVTLPALGFKNQNR